MPPSASSWRPERRPAAAAATGASDTIRTSAVASIPAERIAAPEPGRQGPLPRRAKPVDTSDPDRVIGNGTPSSCTSAAVVDAVAAGGVITFDCGPAAVTIEMDATAKVVNTSRIVVLDGGGLVTLSGRDERRILYMNTCDPAQVWTTSHCQNQDHPRADDPEHVVHPRQRHRAADRGRRWWRGQRRCGVRPRWPGAGARQHVHRESLRCDRTRRRRRRTSCAEPVRRSTGDRRRQHVRRECGDGQRLLERRRHLEHRRVVGDLQQRVHAQPSDRQRREPRPAPAPPAAATAGRSISTATASRSTWSTR